jgi:LmbE family N-acetylglucosaminyl deacetylase
MRVLVIAPHPDDESIGCGGTLCKHTANGDHVVAVFLTSGELGLKHLSSAEAWKIREQEARTATRILGLAETHFLRGPDWTLADHISKIAADLRPIMKGELPDLVYLPHPREWHPDHKAALPIVREALDGTKLPTPILRAYEVWTPNPEYDQVENITSVMPRKMRAIRAHRSQLKDLAYDRAAHGLNEYRGALSGRCRFAEVFQALIIT